MLGKQSEVNNAKSGIITVTSIYTSIGVSGKQTVYLDHFFVFIYLHKVWNPFIKSASCDLDRPLNRTSGVKSNLLCRLWNFVWACLVSLLPIKRDAFSAFRHVWDTCWIWMRTGGVWQQEPASQAAGTVCLCAETREASACQSFQTGPALVSSGRNGPNEPGSPRPTNGLF